MVAETFIRAAVVAAANTAAAEVAVAVVEAVANTVAAAAEVEVTAAAVVEVTAVAVVVAVVVAAVAAEEAVANTISRITKTRQRCYPQVEVVLEYPSKKVSPDLDPDRPDFGVRYAYFLVLKSTFRFIPERFLFWL